MIQQYIYNFLTSESGFIDNIRWGDELELTQYPGVVFKRISSPGFDQTDDKWERWRFYIIGRDPWELDALSGTLITLLNRLYGDVEGKYIDFVQLIDVSSIEKRDDNLFSLYVDFRFLYHN